MQDADRQRTDGPAKRILLVEANEDGTVGGSHQALFDLTCGLDTERYEPVVLFYQDNLFAARLREEGVETMVYADVREQERYINVTAGPTRKLLGFGEAILRRRRLLRDLRIALVHINNSPKVGNRDWLPAAWLAGIPCIAAAMGDAEGEQEVIKRWLFRSFRAVIPVSRYIEEAMLRQRIPPERLFTVNHGVDIGRLRGAVRRSRKEVCQEVGVDPGNVLIVMIANIREFKGQHVLLDALGMMDPPVRSRLHVLFAGAVGTEDDAYVRRIREQIRRLDLDPYLTFLGSRRDVPDLLNAADIAVHASVIPEPGGIAVLEAMAMGTAVVAADKGGHVEYILPGTGHVHDVEQPAGLADILTDLVKDSEQRAKLGKAAAERAGAYSIARNVRRTEEVYDHLLR